MDLAVITMALLSVRVGNAMFKQAVAANEARIKEWEAKLGPSLDGRSRSSAKTRATSARGKIF